MGECREWYTAETKGPGLKSSSALSGPLSPCGLATPVSFQPWNRLGFLLPKDLSPGCPWHLSTDLQLHFCLQLSAPTSPGRFSVNPWTRSEALPPPISCIFLYPVYHSFNRLICQWIGPASTLECKLASSPLHLSI